MERWGQYFKPAGMSQATGDPNKPAARTAAAPVDDHIDDAPAPVVNAAPAAAAPAGDNSRAQDILAMIRNRQKQ
jgi:hypothetical protein